MCANCIHLFRYDGSLSSDAYWPQQEHCGCMQSVSELGEAEDNAVQRDPRASSAAHIEEAQVDLANTPTAAPQSASWSSPTRLWSASVASSRSWTAAAPAITRWALRPTWIRSRGGEGKPQHYSEPKLILDLSHWRHNSMSAPRGGSAEKLPVELEICSRRSHAGWRALSLGSNRPVLLKLSHPVFPSSAAVSYNAPHSHMQIPAALQLSSPPTAGVLTRSSPLLHLLPSSPSSPHHGSANYLSSSIRCENDEENSQMDPSGEEHFDLDVFISQALRLCSRATHPPPSTLYLLLLWPGGYWRRTRTALVMFPTSPIKDPPEHKLQRLRWSRLTGVIKSTGRGVLWLLI